MHQTAIVNAEVLSDNVNQNEYWRIHGQVVDVDADDAPLSNQIIKIEVNGLNPADCNIPLTVMPTGNFDVLANLQTYETGWFDFRLRSKQNDGVACENPLPKGVHTLTLLTQQSQAYKNSTADLPLHLWAIPQFSEIDPSSSVTRSSQFEFLTINGILKETYSQAPVDDMDLNLTISGQPITLLSSIDWREGGRFRDIKAIVPTSTPLNTTLSLIHI